MKKILSLTVIVLMLALAVLPATGCHQYDSEINVLNWGDYIDPELIDDFEAEYNIKVNYTYMSSNEEMITQLESPDCIYDLCFPSDYIIEKLVGNDMLYELDMSHIPNMENVDPRFLDLSFDPGNRYSVPYMWGTVGILYNTTLVDDEVTSWNILWDAKYEKQILMYDSMRDSIAVGLLKLGYDINTRDKAEITAARDVLVEQWPLVKAYLGDSIKDRMINNSAALSVVYSGDAMYCIGENEDLAYAVPDEGSNLWFDNMIIPKTAKHKDEAEMFINFLCDGEVAKQNAEYIGYSTTNSAALVLMGDDYILDETYNPKQEVLDRCSIFHDLGDFVDIYNDAWIYIKTQG